MQAFEFDLKYTTREITAWGGLALLKRMMDGMGLRQAIEDWALPAPRSNRGYAPRATDRTNDCQHMVWRSTLCPY